MDDPFVAFTREPDAETQNHLRLVGQMLVDAADIDQITVAQMREQADNDPLRPPPLDVFEERTAGGVPVRVYAPETVDGIYLYIHGGGWVGGRPIHSDHELYARANAARVAIVGIDYRLAPEHPYPTPNDDCEAATLWLVRNALQEFGTDRIVIGGESAGAHLTAATALRMRDRHGYTGFAGAEMRYGLYDLRVTPSVRNFTGGTLEAKAINKLIDWYIPEGNREEPDASPLLGSLHDMPPALFTVGTLDSLVDDTLFMWARWRAAGNVADLRVYSGGLHAFDKVPFLPIAIQCQQDIASFIRDRIEA